MSELETVYRFLGVEPSDGPWPIIIGTAGRPQLCQLFATMGYTRGAEVGVWTGHFSKRLCESISGVHLTCVDPWQPYADYRERKNDPERLASAYREACERLAPFGCTVLRMTSLEAAHIVPDGSLDFVYLDGNHERSFVAADLAAWTPKIRMGGIFAGHDYRTDARKPFIEVQAAVDEFTRERGIGPWFVLAAERSPSFFWVVS